MKPTFWTLFFLAFLGLSGCGGGGGGSSSADARSGNDYANVRVFRQQSPYADILKTCVLAETAADSCLLADLPLLVEEGAPLRIEQIMQRVLVSHGWMGARFAELLAVSPPELLELFAALSAIVIHSDVRPSYYDPALNTIFLDPAYLWLTVEEKRVISPDPDYRSDFADELAFVSLARYVSGNRQPYRFYSLEDQRERSFDEIVFQFTRVMLHELLHANDSFPPAEAPYLDQNQTLWEAYTSLRSKQISRALANQFPLQSELLYDLAEVMYLGETASVSLRRVSAADAGRAMAADYASDDYAYASIREDAAMLFEEAMVKYLFNYDRDIAYTNRPPENAYCEDYIVAWGQRGRIGDEDVKERAAFVVAAVYPGRDFKSVFPVIAFSKRLVSGAKLV